MPCTPKRVKWPTVHDYGAGIVTEVQGDFKVLKEIREFIGEKAKLHVQAVAGTTEGMVEEVPTGFRRNWEKYVCEEA